MKAWMRGIFCASGTAIAVAFCNFGLGCTSGSYTLRVRVTPLGVWMDLLIAPLDNSNQFDLDGLLYQWFDYKGKMYRYYPSKGWFYDPETGQLYQLDDPSWQHLRDNLKGASHVALPMEQRSSKEVARKSMGIFNTTLHAGMGFQTERVSISLHIDGDTPLPIWDVDRWSTLTRNLFVFPDGIVGSPDPMRLELSGEASDVLGYLSQLGVTQGGTTTDGTKWTILFDDDHQWADVFTDKTLFTTVPLN